MINEKPVIVIGAECFSEHEEIESVSFSGTVVEIGSRAFGFCYLHEAEVVLKEGLIAIESHIFFLGLGSNLKLRIPDSVKEIVVGAFEPGMEITLLCPYDKGWFMK